MKEAKIGLSVAAAPAMAASAVASGSVEVWGVRMVRMADTLSSLLTASMASL